MKTTTLLSFIMTGLLITAMMACKKSTGAPTGPNSALTCNIIGVTDNNNGAVTNYTISYNGDFSMAAVTAQGAINFNRVFTYASGYIFVSVSDSTGTENEDDMVTLDTGGRVITIRKYYPATVTYNYLIMTYITGNELGDITATNKNGNFTTSYDWLGGDIIRASGAGTETNYTYNTNMPLQDGDYLKINSLLYYATYYIKNTHLLKSQSTTGQGTTNYNYVMNANGYIDRLAITNGTATETMSYQYQCH